MFIGVDHVGIRGQHVVCDHCMERKKVLPCHEDKLAARIKPFIDEHLKCPKPKARA